MKEKFIKEEVSHIHKEKIDIIPIPCPGINHTVIITVNSIEHWESEKGEFYINQKFYKQKFIDEEEANKFLYSKLSLMKKNIRIFSQPNTVSYINPYLIKKVKYKKIFFQENLSDVTVYQATIYDICFNTYQFFVGSPTSFTSILFNGTDLSIRYPHQNDVEIIINAEKMENEE